MPRFRWGPENKGKSLQFGTWNYRQKRLQSGDVLNKQCVVPLEQARGLRTTIEDLTDKDLRITAVRQAVREAKFSKRQREVIELKYLGDDERTDTEIAQILGVSKPDVGMHKQAAIRKLRHPQIAKLLRDF